MLIQYKIPFLLCYLSLSCNIRTWLYIPKLPNTILRFKTLESVKRINLGLDNYKRTQLSSKYRIVYLIYIRLQVHAILLLAYLKELYIILKINICCYMPSSFIWRIYLHSNTVFSTFTMQSLSFIIAIFLITCSCSGGTTIWVFYLLWQEYSYLTWSVMAESYSYQYLITETSVWGNKSYTTETSNISYSSFLYIKLVVTL